MDDRDWKLLVDKVRRRQCTPFLGAGVSRPHVPLGAEVAESLAREFGYPLKDQWNLPRVTQFLATTFDPEFAKARIDELVREAESRSRPDFAKKDQPHRILADLQLPLYITTNYDRFMSDALAFVGAQPTSYVARWNFELRSEPVPRQQPTPERPVVFHLHGQASRIPSILVTEDDYVEFMTEAQVAPDDVVPGVIKRAMATTNLLFVGYSLHDWNFRVLLRSLMRRIPKTSQRFNISVQMPPGESLIDDSRQQEAERFLCDYLETEKVTVHWGDAGDFLRELRRQCDAPAQPQPA